MALSSLSIDQPRLDAELAHLATFTDDPAPAVSRVVFSPTDIKAREYIKKLMTDAGMTVREDAIGNTFARWVGSDAGAGAVGTGSHADAIPNAGAYDGTVGVLGGIEAVRALRRAGFRPRRSIEVVLFTSEEPTRFGVGCTGSRAMAGAYSAENLRALKDSEGDSYEVCARRAGFSAELGSVRLPKGYYDAWVELHIEQGPVLEAERLDIGVVEAIAAPSTYKVRVEGEGGHAGGLLMPLRHDALCGASEMILAVEDAAKSSGSPDTVATVGWIKVHPGAVNSVPSRVEFKIDLRDIRLETRERAFSKMWEAAQATALRRGLGLHIETLNSDPPAQSAGEILAAIEQSCAEAGAKSRRLISRAYHDTLFMARIVPVAMIFIPCRGGVSHRPDEYSSPGQIEKGVDVLARTLARLAE